MACSDNAVKITSISHGATSLAEPVGGSITEEVSTIANRPSTRKAPCLSIDTYGVRASARFQGLTTPIAVGTKATLTYVLEQQDGGSTSVAVANMVKTGGGFDIDSVPKAQTYEFEYDSGNSDVTNPITVS